MVDHKWRSHGRQFTCDFSSDFTNFSSDFSDVVRFFPWPGLSGWPDVEIVFFAHSEGDHPAPHSDPPRHSGAPVSPAKIEGGAAGSGGDPYEKVPKFHPWMQ